MILASGAEACQRGVKPAEWRVTAGQAGAKVAARCYPLDGRAHMRMHHLALRVADCGHRVGLTVGTLTL